MAVSLDELEDVILKHPDPVVTTGDLADEFDDVTKRHILDQLRLLERTDAIESKEIGARAIAWWHTERVNPPRLAPEDHPDQRELEEIDVDVGADRRVDELEDVGGRDDPADAEDSSPVVDEIIQQWRPGRSADERGKRRRVGREALLWLQSQNGPASRADFESALYDDETDPSADTWWRKWVRPALKHADHAGKVEFRLGHHDYEWTGE